MEPDPVNRCFVAVQKVVPDFEGMRTLPPASNEQIAALETAIGLTLPSELVAWLKLVNGHHHGFCVSLGWNLLSTDEIAMHWGFFAEPAQAIAPLIQRTDHPHRVKVPSTFTKRIPIASDYSGNLLMIDLDPISAEFLGQIVFVERTADSVSFVVMSSFEALLNAISAQIDTGELALVDGNLVFTNNNAGMLRPWYVLSRGFRYPASSSDTALMSKAETETPQVSDSPTAGATQTESTGLSSVQTEPTIDERAAFVSGLTDAQRSACYVAQNDLLQTDQFGPQDLDLIRSIVLNAELAAAPDFLKGLPFLRSIRIDGDATPAFFAVLANLAISDLCLQSYTDDGLAGVEALQGNTTLRRLTAMRADQHAFDIFTTCTSVVSLSVVGSTINDLSSIANLPKLATLYINDTGQPDPTPAYEHPTLKEFSLTWRRPLA